MEKFVIGVNIHQHLKLDGNGSHLSMFGTDGGQVAGTIGVHPREASQPVDGPGIVATGIMEGMSSGTIMELGIDSKVENGLFLDTKFQLVLKYQEKKIFADLSCF